MLLKISYWLIDCDAEGCGAEENLNDGYCTRAVMLRTLPPGWTKKGQKMFCPAHPQTKRTK